MGSSKEAEWLPKVVHSKLKQPRGRHGRHQVLNMFKTDATRTPMRLVAQRLLKGSTGEVQALPWLQSGGTVVAQYNNSYNSNNS